MKWDQEIIMVINQGAVTFDAELLLTVNAQQFMTPDCVSISSCVKVQLITFSEEKAHLAFFPPYPRVTELACPQNNTVALGVFMCGCVTPCGCNQSTNKTFSQKERDV